MIFLAISLVLVLIMVIGTTLYGFKKRKEDSDKGKLKRVLKINMTLFISVISFSVLFLIPKIIFGLTSNVGAAQTDAVAAVNPSAGLGYLACAICTSLGCIGAGYAVAQVGAAALGAVSEDQTLFGKTLIYVGLAEGIAIYGLLISILILLRL